MDREEAISGMSDKRDMSQFTSDQTRVHTLPPCGGDAFAVNIHLQLTSICCQHPLNGGLGMLMHWHALTLHFQLFLDGEQVVATVCQTSFSTAYLWLSSSFELNVHRAGRLAPRVSLSAQIPLWVGKIILRCTIEVERSSRWDSRPRQE